VNQFKGWDWWAMQLEDGSEVMLFQFRDWDSVLVSQAGTIVDPAGNLTHLEGFDDFTVESLRTWASPHTDGVYPLDWDIHIAPEGGDAWQVEVRTSIDDQEMHNLAQNYWEGAVTVTGTRGSDPIEGLGFVELTGYATDSLDP
jgi:predicted secreted hydrolase